MLVIRMHGTTERDKERARRLIKYLHNDLESDKDVIFACVLCGWTDQVKHSGASIPTEMEQYLDAEIRSTEELGPEIPIDPPKGWKPKKERGNVSKAEAGKG
jgi:hypothetical protein